MQTGYIPEPKKNTAPGMGWLFSIYRKPQGVFKNVC